MITAQTHEFGVLEIYENYVKAIMFEGVTVKPKHNKVLQKIADTYFKDKNFAYISHRINSYSVNPRVYIETSKISNLKALAFVSKDPLHLSNLEIEKLFSNKPFASFKEIKEAIQWIEPYLKS